MRLEHKITFTFAIICNLNYSSVYVTMVKISPSKEVSKTTKKPKVAKLSRFHLISGVFNFSFGIIMFMWLFNVILEAGERRNSWTAIFFFQSGRQIVGFLLMAYFVYRLISNRKGLPIPIQSKFYLYEIRNSRQFLRGSKPVLHEHGPYTYNQYRTREIISWSKDKDKVKFREHYTFSYNQQLSDPTASKQMHLLNTVFLMALALERIIIRRWGIGFLEPVVGNVMNSVFHMTNEALIDLYTPHQYLEGRNITLLGLLHLVTQPLKQLGIPIDLKFGQFGLTGSTFGFVLMRGGGPFGPFEMYTGQNGKPGFNHFAAVLGKKSVQGYLAPCNSIYGSDGVFYGRNIAPNQTLLLFNSQLCRTFHLEYVRETSFAGVPVLEYTIPLSVFDQHLRKNHCFCSARNKINCNGLSDLSACMGGIPLLISFPHFYGANEQLRNFESGLVPTVNRHKTHLYIEPTLGITIGAYVRLQMNVQIEPHLTVPSLNKLPRMIMPLFWLEEGAVVDSYWQYLLVAGIYGLHYGVYGFLLMAFLGLIQICFAFLIYYARRQEEDKLKQEKLLSKSPMKLSKGQRREQQLNQAQPQLPTQSLGHYAQVDLVKSEIKELRGQLQLRSPNIEHLYYLHPNSL